MLTVGNTEPIELVDGNGVSISGAAWSVSNPVIAQIDPPANGQPMLVQGNAAGITTLTAAYANQTGTATVTVLPGGGSLPSNGVAWSAPSLGSYGISKIIPAVPSQGGAAFYAEDDGAYAGNGAIRAFDVNGQQLSIWPGSSASDAFPLLVAADNQGGALYFANQDNPNQFQSYCYFGRMDQSGNETWEYQESNCNEDTAVGPDGTIYLLEDDFQNSGNNVLTALDPTSGQIKFTVLLPGFDTNEGGADYTMMPPPGDPNGPQQPYCTPGTTISAGSTSTNAQSFEHGNMFVGAYGTIYIPLTGGTTYFDGEPCNSTPDPSNPGYTTVVTFANDSQGSFTDTRTLYLMAVNTDGSYSVQTIDNQTLTGPGWLGAPQYDVFLQRGAPDGQGGVFLPIEQTLYYTGGTNVSLPFPVPPGDDLALGSDGTAYVRQWDPNGSGYRNILSAVDNGTITWTYQASQGNLNVSSALDGGGIAVSNDELGLFVVDSTGTATSTGFTSSDISLTSSWQDQWYATNVPGTGGGVSLLALTTSADPDSFWPNPSVSETAEPMCPCDVQTSDSSSDPPSIPISSLKSPEVGSPSCTTLTGSGPTDLILVGDEGLVPHDVGQLFNLAAQQKANDLNAGDDNVIACRVSSADDTAFTLIGGLPGEGLVGQITGGVFYFGHSGIYAHQTVQGVQRVTNGYESIVAAGQSAAGGLFPRPNVDANTVKLLAGVQTGYRSGGVRGNILSVNTSLLINGCTAGVALFDYLAQTYTSIAQLIANNIRRGVYAYTVGVYFSQQGIADDPWVTGTDFKGNPRTIPESLPIYMVPVGTPHNKPNPKGFTPQ